MQDAQSGVLGGHEGHTPKSCCPLRLILLISRKYEKSYAYILHFCVLALLHSNKALPNNVQLLQNREYLQYGLSNVKHR